MAKALKPITVILLLLSIGSLVFGIMLFGKREILKVRAQNSENALGRIADNIAFEDFNSARLIVENKEQLPGMKAELDKLATAAGIVKENLDAAKVELAETKDELGRTKDELARTQADLKNARDQIASLNDSIDEKNAEISRKDTQIATLEQDKTNLQLQIDDLNNKVIAAEEKVLDAEDQVRNLEEEVKDLYAQLGIKTSSTIPKGLTGRILVVNPDWNFVVIDLGSDDGLVSNAEMLIHRDDMLIGKVTISGVSREMAIAELNPAWLEGEVKAGDLVVR